MDISKRFNICSDRRPPILFFCLPLFRLMKFRESPLLSVPARLCSVCKLKWIEHSVFTRIYFITVTEVLEMLPEAAGPTLGQQITYLFFFSLSQINFLILLIPPAQTRRALQMQWTNRRCKEEFLHFNVVIKICFEKKLSFCFSTFLSNKKLLHLNSFVNKRTKSHVSVTVPVGRDRKIRTA